MKKIQLNSQMSYASLSPNPCHLKLVNSCSALQSRSLMCACMRVCVCMHISVYTCFYVSMKNSLIMSVLKDSKNVDGPIDRQTEEQKDGPTSGRLDRQTLV